MEKQKIQFNWQRIKLNHAKLKLNYELNSFYVAYMDVNKHFCTNCHTTEYIRLKLKCTTVIYIGYIRTSVRVYYVMKKKQIFVFLLKWLFIWWKQGYLMHCRSMGFVRIMNTFGVKNNDISGHFILVLSHDYSQRKKIGQNFLVAMFFWINIIDLHHLLFTLCSISILYSTVLIVLRLIFPIWVIESYLYFQTVKHTYTIWKPPTALHRFTH